MTEEHRQKLSEAQKKKWTNRTEEERKRPHPIYWVEADKVFSCREEAMKMFDCSTSTITKLLQGKQKTVNGIKTTLRYYS